MLKLGQDLTVIEFIDQGPSIKLQSPRSNKSDWLMRFLVSKISKTQKFVKLLIAEINSLPCLKEITGNFQNLLDCCKGF